jgi:hypothetical protein
MYSLHMNKFGKAVAKGAGYGALGMAAVTADSGNPLANLAAGAVVGGVSGAVKHVVDHRKAVNAAKHSALGRQFK